jgi:hypothetical protein
VRQAAAKLQLEKEEDSPLVAELDPRLASVEVRRSIFVKLRLLWFRRQYVFRGTIKGFVCVASTSFVVSKRHLRATQSVTGDFGWFLLKGGVVALQRLANSLGNP